MRMQPSNNSASSCSRRLSKRKWIGYHKPLLSWLQVGRRQVAYTNYIGMKLGESRTIFSLEVPRISKFVKAETAKWLVMTKKKKKGSCAATGGPTFLHVVLAHPSQSPLNLLL